MTVLFWISLDQICPNWIKLDQIGSITNQKGPGAILTQFLCLCLPKRHTAQRYVLPVFFPVDLLL